MRSVSASDEPGAPGAGATFTTLRSTEGYAPGVNALRMLARRFTLIGQALGDMETGPAKEVAASLREVARSLDPISTTPA